MEHERLNRSRGPSNEACARAATSIKAVDPALPTAQGLYDPRHEHDACGVGFIADMPNRKSHAIVTKGLQILINLDHRGAVGADPKLGDGCGMLVQIPHRFFSEEMAKAGVRLPEPRLYGIGQFFMPRDEGARSDIRAIVERVVGEEGLTLLGWRDVPVDNSDLGEAVKAVEPVHSQVFLGRGPGVRDEDDFERRLYVARKVVSNAIYAAGKRRDGRVLSGLDVVPHHRLQGHGARAPARQLFPRSHGRALRERARARASALFDEHVPVLAARAPLSHGRA